MRGPNPLARAVWGVEPESPRLRRRAWLIVLGHALIYPCAVGSILGLLWWLAFGRVGPPPSGDDWCAIALLVSTLSAVGTVVVLLLLRVLITGAGERMRANREDYLLAGLTPRQILWGIDAPAIRGLKVTVTVQGLWVAAMMLWFVTEQELIGDDWVLVPFLIAIHGSMLIALVGGYLMAMGMWAWTTARLSRLLAVIAFGAVTPLILFIFLAAWFDSDELIEAGIVVEFLFWPVKIGWLVHHHPRVLAKIEGGD